MTSENPLSGRLLAGPLNVTARHRKARCPNIQIALLTSRSCHPAVLSSVPGPPHPATTIRGLPSWQSRRPGISVPPSCRPAYRPPSRHPAVPILPVRRLTVPPPRCPAIRPPSPSCRLLSRVPLFRPRSQAAVPPSRPLFRCPAVRRPAIPLSQAAVPGRRPAVLALDRHRKIAVRRQRQKAGQTSKNIFGFWDS